MRITVSWAATALVLVAGAWLSTYWVASLFAFPPALGGATVAALHFYWPWDGLTWDLRWSRLYPRPFALARLIETLSLGFSFFAFSATRSRDLELKPSALGAWANFDDVRRAHLLSKSGAVLGRFHGELLAYDGPEHQLLIGASRSGKGRGHVVPTLLATEHSALVLDIKGELADGDRRHGFPGTAGFRETLGPVLRFAPTRALSARFNPMFEIQKGANEVRGAQNLIDVLLGAYEDRAAKDFWLRSAANIAAPVLLHVLYTEPLERKTLAIVREKLRTLAKTCEHMRITLHRKDPKTGSPEVHPEILHAAESFLSAEERVRSGIQATAESMFGVFADPLVAQNTATSDFRISDLMCLDRPATLYLQPPASDVMRLMPLIRLIVDVCGRTLMESQTEDSLGRTKQHRLLLLLDEFPMLGRMPFFEMMMGAMGGYGLKAYLVCQSLNHIARAYGRDNVILDNCHIVTAFAGADSETAKRIADMAGEIWEVRENQTQQKPKPLLGYAKGSMTQREERRPLLLPGEVRSLPRDEQLIFVSGAKPIRAKKIRFDEEAVFQKRLRFSSQNQARLTTTHDWIDVRPLGLLEASAMSVTPSQRTKATTSPQGELFGQPPGPSPSDLEVAGFRDGDGSRPHPRLRGDRASKSKGI